MTIEELINKRNKLVHDMRDMVNKNPEGFTAEQEQKYSAMESDMEKIGAQIERMKSLNDFEASLDKPMTNPLTTAQNSKPVDEDKYKEAFFALVKHGANGLTQDQKQMLNVGLEKGTPNKGGYLVPTVIANEIITGLQKRNWIRSLANVYTTSSETDIPVDTSIPDFGWLAEKAPYGQTDLTFGNVTIGAHKVGGIIKISEELLEDSGFNLEAHLQKKIIWGLDAAEETAFISGDGVDKPTGITTSAAAGVTTASTTAFTSDEVMDFVYSLSARYREDAVVVGSSDFVKLVRKLKDGNGQYIWEPSYKAGEPDMLLGKPLRESEYMDAVATGATPAVIANFGYYDIADRGGIYLQRLVEKYADTGEVGFRVRKRVDGKLTLADAAKTLKMA